MEFCGQWAYNRKWRLAVVIGPEGITPSARPDGPPGAKAAALHYGPSRCPQPLPALRPTLRPVLALASAAVCRE